MAVAVNVTPIVGHTGFDDTEMVIPAATGWITFIRIGFDAAGLPTGQSRFEISWQVTTFPLVGVYVYVGELFPTGWSLTFH